MKEKLFTLSRKDFEVQTFCSGGPGGQHQNKTSSGVRIVHKDSGAVGESRTERSQHVNKKLAFERLTESAKFKIWLNRKVFELQSQKTIEQKVDEQIVDKNLQFEIKENGKWTKIDKIEEENELQAKT